MPRRQFDLPSFDVAHLETTGLEWETVVEGEARWLLLHDRPVAQGYNVAKALTAIRIAPSYPEAQIDMVYFHPPLVRSDGRTLSAVSEPTIDGKLFQQWSRHRTNENPWRPGEDDISSHLALVDGWLEKELRRA
ncbi:MAG: E2/UBC family protein [Myxococcota bacterium]